MGTQENETTLKPFVNDTEAYELMYENIPVGVVVCDNKGRIIRMNKRNREIFGILDVERVYGFCIFDDINIEPTHRELMRSNDDYTYSYDLNKDNLTSRGKCDVDGKRTLLCRFRKIYNEKHIHTGYILVNVDLTDTQSSLRNETMVLSRQLQQIHKAANMMSWRFDVGKGRVFINYANAPTEYISKVNIIKEYNLTEFVHNIHPDDQHIFLEKFALVMQRQTDELVVEVRFLFEDELNSSKYLWAYISGIVTEVDKNNKIQLMVGFIRLIESRKHMENALLEAKEKAEASDKLKTAFIEQTNHEIRTPLNAIIGYADILASCHNSLDSDSMQDLVQGIRQNSDKMLKMVNNILILSQLSSSTLKVSTTECSIYDICSGVYTKYSKYSTENVKLIFEPEDNQTLVYTDSHLISLVVSQLVDNGLKFTKNGNVTIRFKKTKNGVEVSVKDTGPGLPSEDSNIFNVFAKGDRFMPGMGLGLPICRGIINTLGATLKVKSAQNEGTTFSFMVPVYTENRD